ncbi:MAG: PAS domain-containing protein [Methanolinea sp.]|nr:PAS domain-containing protein [Methanolinea sp.]
MNFSTFLKGEAGLWNASLIGTTAGSLVINALALVMGINVAFPHLLYIPVVIGAYRHPRQGLILSAGIGAVYLALVMVLTAGNSSIILESVVRVAVLVFIGWLISTLSSRLRSQEELYRGLFDNSEAGSILICVENGQRIVEEVNWSAAHLLERTVSDLRGAPLTTFMGEDIERGLFVRLAEEGKIYAEETVFMTASGRVQHVLVSLAALPGGRSIITCVDITRRVSAEDALLTANIKLHLLSRISSDHLNRTVDRIIETLDSAPRESFDAKTTTLLETIRNLVWNLARQLFLTESYQDLGSSPPEWIGVQDALDYTDLSGAGKNISVRMWTERLEVYADPLFRNVIGHLIENSIRHGSRVRNIIVTYREIPGALELFVEDDGIGIPEEKKETIFEYDSGQHAGLGLFICRQIIAVTGMTISEMGQPGKGAQFVIRIPEGDWRIEGRGEDAPPFSLPSEDTSPEDTSAFARELISAEFPIANALWVDYHDTHGDPVTDRIFAAFAGGEAVSLARCRHHPDGLEVDAVFTPVKFRGHGYAHLTVHALIEACGKEMLYMHSVLNLTEFYGKYGFIPIREDELPPTIRDRFAFAGGQLEGANVQPMKREPSP